MRIATRWRDAWSSFEQFEQIAIRVDTFRLRSHFVFERWKHPLRESGQVNVEPVVVPVKLSGFQVSSDRSSSLMRSNSERTLSERNT